MSGGTHHYFSSEPTVQSAPRTVDLDLPDFTARLRTDRGVFAGRSVDPGTLILLARASIPPPTGHLLDLGCGYGPLAITLARRSPGSTVWALDVNTRALELTRVNAAAMSLANVSAVTGDEIPAKVRFAAIYSNPPIRVGKKVLHELLLRWLDRLAEDGRAHLVVQKNLGSDSLHRWLIGEGFPTERQTSEQGYRILVVAPREHTAR